MKPPHLLVLIVLISLVLGSGGEALASPPSLTSQPSPVVTDLADGIRLDWQLPFPSISAQTDGSILVQLNGFEPEQVPGALELPFTSRLIALPPGSSPEIIISNEISTEISLAKPLAVVPPAVLTQPDGTLIDTGDAVSSPTPAAEPQLAELKDLGDLRGVRLASLTIHPVLPQSDGLKIYSQLSVEIKFNSANLPGASRPETVQNELAGLVINPQDIATVSQPASITPQSLDAQAPTAAIEIASEGIYRVSGSGLAGIGFPIASVNPHLLHLTRAGADIPFEWEGNGDNTFSTSESLVFYALPRFSRWATNDVYFLSTTAAASPLIPSLDAAVGGETAGTDWFEQTFEQNTYYMPDCLCAPVPMGRDGDRWVWGLPDGDSIYRKIQNQQLFTNSPRSFPFSLVNVNNSQTAELKVWLIGKTDNLTTTLDHRVQVNVNGFYVGTMEWNGKQAVQGTFNIPTGKLQANNTLGLALPGINGVNLEEAWLDAFSVRYQPGGSTWAGEAYFYGSGGSGKYYQVSLNDVASLRVYDVTNPVSPVRLANPGISGAVVSFADKTGSPAPRFAVVAGAKVKAPALLRMAKTLNTQSTAGARLVFIAPEGWSGALTGLVNLRQSQGLSPVIEYTQSIYDTYGGGIPTPDAIRAYLQDIYSRWNPQPQYVLLAGDGSIDPKKYHSNSFTTIIPPYLADFDVNATEGATDNRFVTFGGPGDLIPDMMIGRLPAKTLAELTTEVNKIVQYETNSGSKAWKNLSAFVSASGFDVASNNEARLLQCTVPADKLYFPVPYATGASIHDAIISRWNAGTGLIVFNGHGSIHSWASITNSVVEFFHYNDVAALTNGLKLPVVLDMTCFTGSYQTPGLESIDEHLVLAGNGGALAAWGSTATGFPTGHEYLTKGFLSNITSQTNPRLGQATLQGKLTLLAKTPSNSDLIDSFNLLGDPTSILSLNPVQSCAFMPSVSR